MSFTLRLTMVIVAGTIIAAIVSPFAAAIAAAIGFHFPFPRIFDRTVMVALLILLIFQARELRIVPLLRKGFSRPTTGVGPAEQGFLIAIAAIAVLVLIAAATGARPRESASAISGEIAKFLLAAVVIAIIEEAFFRAVLLGGMESDFGRSSALVLSSAIYSIAHLVRSPKKFYVSGIHPLLGLHNLGASLEHLANFQILLPTFIGLFLLGLVLGEAFLLTGRVYFAAGLHAGFVLGAKLWPRLTSAGVAAPVWLRGWGREPLISGVAAWIMALALLILVRPLTRTRQT